MLVTLTDYHTGQLVPLNTQTIVGAFPRMNHETPLGGTWVRTNATEGAVLVTETVQEIGQYVSDKEEIPRIRRHAPETGGQLSWGPCSSESTD